jgi:hypothetical protein
MSNKKKPMENKPMTFEQALQKVAEKYGYKNFGYFRKSKHHEYWGIYYTEAAELWQSSNLERIKELEDGLKELHHHITTFDGVDREAFNKAIQQAKSLL